MTLLKNYLMWSVLVSIASMYMWCIICSRITLEESMWVLMVLWNFYLKIRKESILYKE